MLKTVWPYVILILCRSVVFVPKFGASTFHNFWGQSSRIGRELALRMCQTPLWDNCERLRWRCNGQNDRYLKQFVKHSGEAVNFGSSWWTAQWQLASAKTIPNPSTSARTPYTVFINAFDPKSLEKAPNPVILNPPGAPGVPVTPSPPETPWRTLPPPPANKQHRTVIWEHAHPHELAHQNGGHLYEHFVGRQQ